MKKYLAFVSILLFLANFVFAYTDYGGGVCGCNTCADCINALNDNSVCYNEVQLMSDITGQVGTCIDNPGNFNNKVFNCQGHTIGGDSSGMDYGIYLNNKENTTLQNCIISGFYTGIYLSSSSNNTLTNNTAYNITYFGFYLSSSSNNTLIDNRAQNSTDGFYLYNNSNNNRVINNSANNQSYHGIFLESSSNNTITGNVVYNNGYYGISLLSSSGNTLADNTAYNNNNGIYLDSSPNTIITNNTAHHNSNRGIAVQFNSNNNRLTNNVVYNNTYGIYLYQNSDNTTLINNTAYNNSGGIRIYLSNYNMLANNTAYENFNYGIILTSGSNYNTIVNNSVHDNGNYGIILLGSCNSNNLTENTAYGNGYSIALSTDSDYNILVNNIAANSTTGFFIYLNSNNNTLKNNTIYNNNQGVIIRSCSNDTITNNFIYNNNAYGFIVEQNSYAITISDNTVYNNSDGISMSSSNNSFLVDNRVYDNSRYGFYLYNNSNNNTLYNNTAYNNSQSGFYLSSSSNNTLINNTLYNNTNYQIYLTSSSDNLIYNNIFNATGIQGVVYDDASNYWNSSHDCSQPNIIGGNCMGGNFYSNYSGVDGDGDGIGDDPPNYSIYGGSNVDYLPLTNNASACFSINTPNKVYALVGNLQGNKSDQICITINASNITLNCNGYNITGNETGTTYGIYVNNRENNTIRNCVISNYTYGIYLDSSSNNTLTNNTANNNSYGIALYSSSNNTVSNNNISSLTQQAVFLNSFANYNKIENNYITSNATYTASIDGNANILQNNTIINTKNLGTAVYVVGNNTVINNTIETTAYQKSGFSTYGSILVSGGYSKIYNNTILGHVYAIYVMGNAQNITIENNTIRDFDNGIVDSKGYIFIDEPLTTAYNERNLNINNNIFFNNSGTNMIRTPQTISSSLKRFYNINITNNRFIDLQGDFSNGAVWLDTITVTATEPIFKNIIITNNYFNNVSFGSWLEGAMGDILIENNTINNTYNSGTGVVCFQNTVCKNITFRRNTIINDTSDYGAINLWNFAENVIITNNTIYDCKYGIYLYRYLNSQAFFGDINITENLLSGIGEAGISMFNATNILVVNNRVYGTGIGTGIFLNFSNKDTLANNTVYNSLYGISFSSSSNNTLINNTLYNNTNYQIYLTSSSDNLIYNNIFNATGTQGVVYDDASNYWNSSYDCSQPNIIGGNCMGGNYYSNYTGYDTDGDGIGEDPYSIYGSSNVDYLPLTNKLLANLTLNASPSWNITYNTTSNVSCSGPAELLLNLYRNGTLVGSGNGYVEEVNTLAAATYNYTCNTSGNENYSSAEVSNILTVNKNNSIVNLLLNDIDGDITVDQGDNIMSNGTLIFPQTGHVELWIDGVLVNSSDTGVVFNTTSWDSGTHTITVVYNETENYTSSTESHTVRVRQPSGGGGGEEEENMYLSWELLCPDNTLNVYTTKSGGNPLQNVRVVLQYQQGDYYYTEGVEYTNSSGATSFTVDKNGTYRILTSKDGYESLTKLFNIELCYEELEEQPSENITEENITEEGGVEEGAPSEEQPSVNITPPSNITPQEQPAQKEKGKEEAKPSEEQPPKEEKPQPSLTCGLFGIYGSFLGICWYWWILLAILLMGVLMYRLSKRGHGTQRYGRGKR